jgi:hypothetical protein
VADNYTISSDTYASDDIGGVDYPRVKIVWGVDGVAVDASATNPLPISDGGGSITTDGDVTSITTSVTPGVSAAHLGKAEDAAHGSGDTGVMALAVRNDGGAALAGTTGDYIPLTTNSVGALYVTGAGGGSQYAEDAAHVSGDIGTISLVVRKDTAAQVAGTDGDYSILTNDSSGRLHTNVGVVPAAEMSTDSIGAADVTSHMVERTGAGSFTLLTPKFAVIDAATGGDNTLVAAVASKKIRVTSLYIVASGGANTVRFESGASGTAKSGQMSIAANGILVLPYNPQGWFETGTNTLLNLELSAATSVDGGLTYVEVA